MDWIGRLPIKDIDSRTVAVKNTAGVTMTMFHEILQPKLGVVRARAMFHEILQAKLGVSGSLLMNLKIY